MQKYHTISYNATLLIRKRITGKICRCSCDSNVQVSTQVCLCLPKDLLDSSDLGGDNNQVVRRKCKVCLLLKGFRCWIRNCQHLQYSLKIISLRKGRTGSGLDASSQLQKQTLLIGVFTREIICPCTSTALSAESSPGATTIMGRYHLTRSGSVTSE